jgi:hypothetical protein
MKSCFVTRQYNYIIERIKRSDFFNMADKAFGNLNPSQSASGGLRFFVGRCLALERDLLFLR